MGDTCKYKIVWRDRDCGDGRYMQVQIKRQREIKETEETVKTVETRGDT